MKTSNRLAKLIVYASCLSAIGISMAIMVGMFHCPMGWKVWIWMGMAAVSLLLLWPLKRYTRIVPILTAILLSVSFLCCSFVEPYFLKEADFTVGSSTAKENIWIAVWVLLAIGLCYLMAHVLTYMMDHLSPNEAVFGFENKENTSPVKASEKTTAVLSGILAVIVLGFGILSGVTYAGRTASIPTQAPYSEADYTIVAPNFKGEYDEDQPTNAVFYGADVRVDYRTLYYIPEQEFVSATYIHGDTSLPLILKYKEHSLDMTKDLQVLSMSYKVSYHLYNTPEKALPEEDKSLLHAILKSDSSLTPVAPTDATHYGYITIRFMNLDHLWWEAELLEKDGIYYVRVATGTDFSNKATGYDPAYVYYQLSQSYR